MFLLFKYGYKLLVAFFAVLGITVFALALWLATYFIWPDISWLETKNPQKTAFMELREKEWAAKKRKVKIRQKWVALSDISPHLRDAVLISEDDKFWTHYGFDLAGIQEAMEKNAKKGKLKAGGSTITQQLAKNLFLTPERSIMRKFKEAALTLRLERTLGKKRILEIYLNVAEWGDGIFGIEAASEAYYGKSAKNLTPNEAARLASALPNPLRFRPTGDSHFVAKRVQYILDIMQKRNEGDALYEEMMAEPEPAETEPQPGDEISAEPQLPAQTPPAANEPEGTK